MRSSRPVETEYLDIQALSIYTCLSPRTLRKILNRQGGPPAYRLPGKILVRRSDWDMWVEQYRREPVNLDDVVDEVLAGFQSKG
jgi:hypothetical protein